MHPYVYKIPSKIKKKNTKSNFRKYDPNGKQGLKTENDYDISLMISTNEFELNEYVRPICLPKTNFKVRHIPNAYSKPKCIASGWGSTESGIVHYNIF